MADSSFLPVSLGTAPALATSVAGIRTLVAEWREAGDRVVLVPTMGALHDGHLSLVERARSLGERCVVSIFVNPMQFGAGEDFSRYPRDLEGDIAKLSNQVDAVFAPATEELYPEGFATKIAIGGPAEGLESAFRPDHFEGVATVVAKLLIAVTPDAAVFGEKDYQQLLVIRRLVADLVLPVEIASAPIVRDDDGLALSSRNAYLTDSERAVAPRLFETLNRIAENLREGELAITALTEAREALAADGFDVDYLELRDAATLAEVTDRSTEPLRLLVAARLGHTRLIDNIPL